MRLRSLAKCLLPESALDHLELGSSSALPDDAGGFLSDEEEDRVLMNALRNFRYGVRRASCDQDFA